jgi:simple sugar transport system ATP-binding protein
MTTAEPILQMTGISKRFPGVQALSALDFRLFPGEVHAVMGQNGAGKSTLIKVLTGVYPSDAGRVVYAGREVRLSGPLEAQRLGIRTVYQEVNLCPNLSVAENVLLGREEGQGAWVLRWKELYARATALLESLSVRIDVTAPLASYSIALQQMCAIARALATQARVLILDEPTSSLSDDEVAMLFSVIRRLKAQGLAVLFISHFLDQTFEIADRITVLRNGALVGEFATASLGRMELIAHMVGRQLVDEVLKPAAPAPAAGDAGPEARVFLSARGLGRRGSVQGVDLEVRPGEALGMGGLLGSGRTETARLLFGLDRADAGVMIVDGEEVAFHAPIDAILRGIGYCPEDRKVEGIIPDLSVRENVTLALLAKRGIFRTLPRREQDAIADRYIRALGIKTPDAETPIAQLSGGNQQKALLARWMATSPRMLILDEPTRGIDVAAKLEIMGQVMELCRQGMAVVFISSEMDEVLRYAHRVLIMRDRRKVGEVAAAETTEQEVFRTIAGGQA